MTKATQPAIQNPITVTVHSHDLYGRIFSHATGETDDVTLAKIWKRREEDIKMKTLVAKLNANPNQSLDDEEKSKVYPQRVIYPVISTTNRFYRSSYETNPVPTTSTPLVTHCEIPNGTIFVERNPNEEKKQQESKRKFSFFHGGGLEDGFGCYKSIR